MYQRPSTHPKLHTHTNTHARAYDTHALTTHLHIILQPNASWVCRTFTQLQSMSSMELLLAPGGSGLLSGISSMIDIRLMPFARAPLSDAVFTDALASVGVTGLSSMTRIGCHWTEDDPAGKRRDGAGLLLLLLLEPSLCRISPAFLRKFSLLDCSRESMMGCKTMGS